MLFLADDERLFMLQLIYISTATRHLVEVEIDELCKRATANNGRSEITGVLARRGEYYLQALEGPKEAVEDTFIRLMRDDRHRDLVLLSRRIITRRDFGEWYMANLGVLRIDSITLRKVKDLLDRDSIKSREVFNKFVSADDDWEYV